jgi:hypothetical protein
MSMHRPDAWPRAAGAASLAFTGVSAAGAACAGVVAVLVTGMVTRRMFEWYLWLLIGPAIAGAASLLARPFAERVAGRRWPAFIGAVAGGLFGAFMAAASIETHQGWSWLAYGALFGLCSAVFVAAVATTGAWAMDLAVRSILHQERR